MPGECVNSEFLTMVSVSDIGECISECQVYTFGGEALCNDFTFYDDSDVSFFQYRRVDNESQFCAYFGDSPASCMRTVKSSILSVTPVTLAQWRAAATSKE